MRNLCREVSEEDHSLVDLCFFENCLRKQSGYHKVIKLTL